MQKTASQEPQFDSTHGPLKGVCRIVGGRTDYPDPALYCIPRSMDSPCKWLCPQHYQQAVERGYIW